MEEVTPETEKEHKRKQLNAVLAGLSVHQIQALFATNRSAEANELFQELDNIIHTHFPEQYQPLLETDLKKLIIAAVDEASAQLPESETDKHVEILEKLIALGVQENNFAKQFFATASVIMSDEEAEAELRKLKDKKVLPPVSPRQSPREKTLVTVYYNEGYHAPRNPAISKEKASKSLSIVLTHPTDDKVQDVKAKILSDFRLVMFTTEPTVGSDIRSELDKKETRLKISNKLKPFGFKLQTPPLLYPNDPYFLVHNATGYKIQIHSDGGMELISTGKTIGINPDILKNAADAMIETYRILVENKAVTLNQLAPIFHDAGLFGPETKKIIDRQFEKFFRPALADANPLAFFESEIAYYAARRDAIKKLLQKQHSPFAIADLNFIHKKFGHILEHAITVYTEHQKDLDDQLLHYRKFISKTPEETLISERNNAKKRIHELFEEAISAYEALKANTNDNAELDEIDQKLNRLYEEVPRFSKIDEIPEDCVAVYYSEQHYTPRYIETKNYFYMIIVNTIQQFNHEEMMGFRFDDLKRSFVHFEFHGEEDETQLNTLVHHADASLKELNARKLAGLITPKSSPKLSPPPSPKKQASPARDTSAVQAPEVVGKGVISQQKNNEKFKALILKVVQIHTELDVIGNAALTHRDLKKYTHKIKALKQELATLTDLTPDQIQDIQTEISNIENKLDAKKPSPIQRFITWLSEDADEITPKKPSMFTRLSNLLSGTPTEQAIKEIRSADVFELQTSQEAATEAREAAAEAREIASEEYLTVSTDRLLDLAEKKPQQSFMARLRVNLPSIRSVGKSITRLFSRKKTEVYLPVKPISKEPPVLSVFQIKSNIAKLEKDISVAQGPLATTEATGWKLSLQHKIKSSQEQLAELKQQLAELELAQKKESTRKTKVQTAPVKKQPQPGVLEMNELSDDELTDIDEAFALEGQPAQVRVVDAIGASFNFTKLSHEKINTLYAYIKKNEADLIRYFDQRGYSFASPTPEGDGMFTLTHKKNGSIIKLNLMDSSLTLKPVVDTAEQNKIESALFAMLDLCRILSLAVDKDSLDLPGATEAQENNIRNIAGRKYDQAFGRLKNPRLVAKIYFTRELLPVDFTVLKETNTARIHYAYEPSEESCLNVYRISGDLPEQKEIKTVITAIDAGLELCRQHDLTPSTKIGLALDKTQLKFSDLIKAHHSAVLKQFYKLAIEFETDGETPKILTSANINKMEKELEALGFDCFLEGGKKWYLRAIGKDGEYNPALGWFRLTQTGNTLHCAIPSYAAHKVEPALKALVGFCLNASPAIRSPQLFKNGQRIDETTENNYIAAQQKIGVTLGFDASKKINISEDITTHRAILRKYFKAAGFEFAGPKDGLYTLTNSKENISITIDPTTATMSLEPLKEDSEENTLGKIHLAFYAMLDLCRLLDVTPCDDDELNFTGATIAQAEILRDKYWGTDVLIFSPNPEETITLPFTGKNLEQLTATLMARRDQLVNQLHEKAPGFELSADNTFIYSADCIITFTDLVIHAHRTSRLGLNEADETSILNKTVDAMLALCEILALQPTGHLRANESRTTEDQRDDVGEHFQAGLAVFQNTSVEFSSLAGVDAVILTEANMAAVAADLKKLNVVCFKNPQGQWFLRNLNNLNEAYLLTHKQNKLICSLPYNTPSANVSAALNAIITIILGTPNIVENSLALSKNHQPVANPEHDQLIFARQKTTLAFNFPIGAITAVFPGDADHYAELKSYFKAKGFNVTGPDANGIYSLTRQDQAITIKINPVLSTVYLDSVTGTSYDTKIALLRDGLKQMHDLTRVLNLDPQANVGINNHAFQAIIQPLMQETARAVFYPELRHTTSIATNKTLAEMNAVIESREEEINTLLMAKHSDFRIILIGDNYTLADLSQTCKITLSDNTLQMARKAEPMLESQEIDIINQATDAMLVLCEVLHVAQPEFVVDPALPRSQKDSVNQHFNTREEELPNQDWARIYFTNKETSVFDEAALSACAEAINNLELPRERIRVSSTSNGMNDPNTTVTFNMDKCVVTFRPFEHVVDDKTVSPYVEWKIHENLSADEARPAAQIIGTLVEQLGARAPFALRLTGSDTLSNPQRAVLNEIVNTLRRSTPYIALTFANKNTAEMAYSLESKRADINKEMRKLGFYITRDAENDLYYLEQSENPKFKIALNEQNGEIRCYIEGVASIDETNNAVSAMLRVCAEIKLDPAHISLASDNVAAEKKEDVQEHFAEELNDLFPEKTRVSITPKIPLPRFHQTLHDEFADLNKMLAADNFEIVEGSPYVLREKSGDVSLGMNNDGSIYLLEAKAPEKVSAGVKAVTKIVDHLKIPRSNFMWRINGLDEAEQSNVADFVAPNARVYYAKGEHKTVAYVNVGNVWYQNTSDRGYYFTSLELMTGPTPDQDDTLSYYLYKDFYCATPNDIDMLELRAVEVINQQTVGIETHVSGKKDIVPYILRHREAINKEIDPLGFEVKIEPDGIPIVVKKEGSFEMSFKGNRIVSDFFEPTDDKQALVDELIKSLTVQLKMCKAAGLAGPFKFNLTIPKEITHNLGALDKLRNEIMGPVKVAFEKELAKPDYANIRAQGATFNTHGFVAEERTRPNAKVEKKRKRDDEEPKVGGKVWPSDIAKEEEVDHKQAKRVKK